MNRLYMPLAVSLLIPTLVANADFLVLKQTSALHQLPVTNAPNLPAANLPQNNASIFLKPQVLSQPASKAPIPVAPPRKHAWRLSEEDYQVGIKDTLTSKEPDKAYAGFLTEMSPGYNIDNNWLGLTKVSEDRNKRSIMLVFCMNKKKKNTAAYQPFVDVPTRTRVHILWTGSKKRMMEQKLIENEYPVDVSIANYKDGYAPREWNLVLPNKKPREIRVSLLWSF